MSDKLPCGHPAELLIRSTESDYQFCELCEMRSQRNDAEIMEERLSARVRSLEAALKPFGALAVLFDKADEFDTSIWARTTDDTPVDLFKLVALVTNRGRDPEEHRVTVGDLRRARAALSP